MVGGQILIVEVGGSAFQVTRIGGRDWGISLVIGLLSIPLGVLVRCLPSAPFEAFLYRIKIFPDPDKLPIVAHEAEDEKYTFNPALDKVSLGQHDLDIYGIDDLLGQG